MKYTEDWKSIKQHTNPEWLLDDKFGIYTHWTPVTVATQFNRGDWYGYCMYMKDRTQAWNGDIAQEQSHSAYDFHREKFGPQETFGYKDIIPMFQPEKFNAKEWADIFAGSGAKFAGPVAMHHDNFAMWDSKATRWNIMKNSGFDAMGELAAAYRDKGMRLITTFHHSYTWHFFHLAHKFDGKDPQYEDLYCEPHERYEEPSEKFEKLWYDKLDEVMVKYQPDLIWFDFGLEIISDPSRRKFMSRYFNLAEDWKKDVAVIYKIKANPPVPEEAGVLDFELGRSDKILRNFWVTDTSFGPWFYQDQIKDGTGLKSAHDLINMLIDIVSKNGGLLLNITPDHNGFIIPYLQEALAEMGKWLKKNGEAVYGSRAWKVYGEGPTLLPPNQGGFNETKGFHYTSDDIRYTRSKDGHTLYASVLDWPGEGNKVLLRALSPSVISRAFTVKRLSILGYEGKVDWTQHAEGLFVTMPSEKVDDIPVIKIETTDDLMSIKADKEFISIQEEKATKSANFMA